MSGSTDTKAIIIAQVWCRAARISQVSKCSTGVTLGIWFITVTIFQVSEANTKAISDIGFIFVICIRHLVHIAVQTNWPHITDMISGVHLLLIPTGIASPGTVDQGVEPENIIISL